MRIITVDDYDFTVSDDPPEVILARAAGHIEAHGRNTGWLADDDDACCPLGAIARARGLTEFEVWCDTAEDGAPGATRVYNLIEADPATALLADHLVAHGLSKPVPELVRQRCAVVYDWNDYPELTDDEVITTMLKAATP